PLRPATQPHHAVRLADAPGALRRVPLAEDLGLDLARERGLVGLRRRRGGRGAGAVAAARGPAARRGAPRRAARPALARRRVGPAWRGGLRAVQPVLDPLALRDRGRPRPGPLAPR